MANPEEHRFVVDRPGVRLDRYVADECPALSRSQAQRLIAEGLVLVNGAPARSSMKPEVGDTVAVALPPPATPEPERIPFTILYEDDDILVIDKPAGLAVHPAPGRPGHTLVNALLAYLAVPPDTGDPLRPGIVHRLDMDTSGVMVIAKNRAAQAHLKEQFRSRQVAKTYVALVRGRLTPERGAIEAPIGRDPGNPRRMAVAEEGRGREARTRYRVLRYADGCSLLEVFPETGRTHQIRVHLAAIGHPVVGDVTYGAPPTGRPRGEQVRQFLHASRIRFRLPSTREFVEFESGMPADLSGALERLSWNPGLDRW